MREDSPLREISCGYECKMVKESGEYQGERYDERQLDIVYNHVAIVDKGRAGPQARLVLDAADGAVEGVDIELKTDSNSTNKQENHRMKVKIKRDALNTGTFKADALSVEVDEGSENAVQIVLDQRDLAVGHIRTLEGKNADIQAKADTLQGEIDQLKKDAVIAPEQLGTMVAERADVLGVAGYVGITTKLDAVDNDGIKKMIVAHKNPDVKLDEATAGYIQGRFDMIVEGIKADNEGLASLASLKAATTSTGTQTKADLDDGNKKLSPREEFAQKSDKMWESKADQE
jgi:hypothetical protein